MWKIRYKLIYWLLKKDLCEYSPNNVIGRRYRNFNKFDDVTFDVTIKKRGDRHENITYSKGEKEL